MIPPRAVGPVPSPPLQVLLASAIAPVLRAPDGSGPTKGRPSRTV